MSMTEFEKIAHLDFDEQLPCEATWCGERPAEWVHGLGCCYPADGRSTILFCGPCHDLMMSQRGLICTVCDTIFTPPETGYRFIRRIDE